MLHCNGLDWLGHSWQMATPSSITTVGDDDIATIIEQRSLDNIHGKLWQFWSAFRARLSSITEGTNLDNCK